MPGNLGSALLLGLALSHDLIAQLVERLLRDLRDGVFKISSYVHFLKVWPTLIS